MPGWWNWYTQETYII